MKKFFFRSLVLLVILAIAGVIALHFFLDSAIKRGVETVGPMVTKVDVKLDSASVSLLNGSGKINGLLIGNPQGFKTPSAVKLGSASLELDARSLLSEKVVIKSVNIQAPEITFESDLKSVNLKKILSNLEETAGIDKAKPQAESKDAKPDKRFQVDDIRITGGKVHVSLTALGGKSATVSLPEIRLSGLGTGPEGITAAELTAKILRSVLDGSIQAGTSAVEDLAKGALYISKDLGKAATENAGKAVEGATGKAVESLGGLLKKK